MYASLGSSGPNTGSGSNEDHGDDHTENETMLTRAKYNQSLVPLSNETTSQSTTMTLHHLLIWFMVHGEMGGGSRLVVDAEFLIVAAVSNTMSCHIG
jgi:hypothetical protein